MGMDIIKYVLQLQKSHLAKDITVATESNK